MFNVLVVTEHEVMFLELEYYFYAQSTLINSSIARAEKDLINLQSSNVFDAVIIDFPSKITFDVIIENCLANNQNSLIYVIFDNLNELLISELIHKGAYSFALKSNLESLVFSVADALKNKERSDLSLGVNRQSYLIPAIFEHAQDPFWIKDKQGKYMYINSAGARFISKPNQEIIGKYDLDVFPKETAYKIYNSDQHVLQTGQTQVIEQTLTNTKAVQRTFQAVKTVFRDKRGNTLGIMGTIRDITD